MNDEFAFPHEMRYPESNYRTGMTLRDYFAAKALSALITQPNKEDFKRGAAGVPLWAAYAYEYADAMMIARGK